MKLQNIRIRVASLIVKDGKILLIAHKKNDMVYWLLPGGGVSFGESLEFALKREIKEELNIAIDVDKLGLICDSIDPDNEKHILNICFFCYHTTGEFVLGNDVRLFDFGFFNSEEILNLQILPPIKNELLKILSGMQNSIYLGRRWEVL